MRQLVEWIRDPVPISEMGAWLGCEPGGRVAKAASLPPLAPIVGPGPSSQQQPTQSPQVTQPPQSAPVVSMQMSQVPTPSPEISGEDATADGSVESKNNIESRDAETAAVTTTQEPMATNHTVLASSPLDNHSQKIRVVVAFLTLVLSASIISVLF